VSQAVAAHHGMAVDPAESPLTPERWGKLGMWVFLAGDAMSFGGLLAAYAALRFTSVDWPNPANVLGISLTAFMTFLLICSSVTMVLGLEAIQFGDRSRFARFIGLTVLGGATFLGCQAYEWSHLIHRGLGLTQNPFGANLFSTTFFLTTGFHGCHVFAGVVYLTVILFRGMAGKYDNGNCNEVEIAGLYWHFVDLIWILVFTFIYLI
jgi:cytochrome c oxidase subunit III